MSLLAKYHQTFLNAIVKKTLNSVCTTEKDAAADPDLSLIILCPCAVRSIV